MRCLAKPISRSVPANWMTVEGTEVLGTGTSRARLAVPRTGTACSVWLKEEESAAIDGEIEPRSAAYVPA